MRRQQSLFYDSENNFTAKNCEELFSFQLVDSLLFGPSVATKPGKKKFQLRLFVNTFSISS